MTGDRYPGSQSRAYQRVPGDGEDPTLRLPTDGRVAVNPQGQSENPVTVPVHVSNVSFRVPTKVTANGAGTASAKVTLTDSDRGLETLPVPDANPSAVPLIVAVTAVWS